ncbi:L,D-transpeptidase [Actinomadura kijaniata]|uniref:L,D-transpeptidase n=1 Tax=Actinomadura kijaniata TaxID=46161 RepID=UPI00082EE6B0|nr:Ig-like domain-containing protein [Actinomadura kijaniata]
MRRGTTVLVLVLGLVAACSSGGGDETVQGGKDGAPSVSISPANATTDAPPDRGVTVTANGGTLSQVTVRSRGAEVPGSLSPDKRTWRSSWTLTPGARYQVSATATGNGKTTNATSGFRTVKDVAATTITNVIPANGQKVGVGMPIMVQFNKPVPERARAAVEHSLEIVSTHPTEGAWRWVAANESFNGLPSVMFRPRRPWAPNQRVKLVAHYAGVRIGDKVFGARDVTREFTVGDAHTVTISATTHRAVARSNGKVVKTWPVSLGRGGDVWPDGVDHQLTTSGVHLTMNKVRLERMESPGKKKGEPGYYLEMVPWAYRISNSGEYIHQNMDDPSCLGNRNCSHGCVRSPEASARWFFNWAYPGDIVNITGTKRKLDWWNGWGYWQMPFERWTEGSALRKPVTTRSFQS